MKQLKVSQFMNSKGFTQSVRKFSAEQKMLVTPFLEGVYKFITSTDQINIIPVEFILEDDLLHANQSLQFYLANETVKFIPALDRLVFSNSARNQISMMDAKTFEIFASASEGIEVEIKRLVHQRDVLTDSKRSDSRTDVSKPVKPLRAQIAILSRLFQIKEAGYNHAIYLRVANAFADSELFEAYRAAAGEHDVNVRNESIRTNHIFQAPKRCAFAIWKHFISMTKQPVKPKRVTLKIAVDSDDDASLSFAISLLETKVAALLEPVNRRASTFGSFAGSGGKSSSTFGGLAPRERHQNTAALLSDLTSEGLQRQAAQTLEHSGSNTTKATLPVDVLCDELRHFLQAYEVGSAAWTKGLCLILKASGAPHLEQLADSWRTKDLIVSDPMDFTSSLGIKESACVLFHMINENLDIIGTEIQVAAVVTKMCTIRLTSQVEQDEFATVAKTITVMLNVIEIDLATKLSKADSLKVIMTLCTNISPTGTGTAQLKRDQRSLLIDIVEHTSSLREAVSLMSIWHSKDVTANAQNRVFAALSAAPVSTKGRSSRYDDETLVGIDTLMLAGTMSKGAKYGAGSNTSVEKTRGVCFRHLRFGFKIPGAAPCPYGQQCKFRHSS